MNKENFKKVNWTFILILVLSLGYIGSSQAQFCEDGEFECSGTGFCPPGYNCTILCCKPACPHSGFNKPDCPNGDADCPAGESCLEGCCEPTAPLACQDSGNPVPECTTDQDCVTLGLGNTCTAPGCCTTSIPLACQGSGNPVPECTTDQDCVTLGLGNTCTAPGCCTTSIPFTCQSGNPPPECSSNQDCLDSGLGNACSASGCCGSGESCNNGTDDDGDSLIDCADVTNCSGQSCSNACQIGGVCDPSGICVGFNPTVCSDDGNPCTDDPPCDPFNGCVHPPKASGTACNDSNPCNGSETCQSGQCTGGSFPDCDAMHPRPCNEDVFCTGASPCGGDPLCQWDPQTGCSWRDLSGIDSDTDTVPNCLDNCPVAMNTNQADLDNDDVGDVCDNCGDISNPFQENLDSPLADTAGDVCSCSGTNIAKCSFIIPQFSFNCVFPAPAEAPTLCSTDAQCNTGQTGTSTCVNGQCACDNNNQPQNGDNDCPPAPGRRCINNLCTRDLLDPTDACTHPNLFNFPNTTAASCQTMAFGLSRVTCEGATIVGGPGAGQCHTITVGDNPSGDNTTLPAEFVSGSCSTDSDCGSGPQNCTIIFGDEDPQTCSSVATDLQTDCGYPAGQEFTTACNNATPPQGNCEVPVFNLAGTTGRCIELTPNTLKIVCEGGGSGIQATCNDLAAQAANDDNVIILYNGAGSGAGTCDTASGACQCPECVTNADCPEGQECQGGVCVCPDGDSDGDGICNGQDTEDCTDNVDNDGDGFADCDDPDCANSPSCGTCTRTIGYWKNHPSAWPVSSVMIGEDVYSKAQAISILNQASSKNATFQLAAQLIAAKLNQSAFGDPGCGTVISNSNNFFQGSIDVGTTLTKAQKAQATSFISQLDACNNSGESFCN